MKSNSILLLLALPLWLASCAPSMDLYGERSIETDEFYLAGGEPHSADAVLDAAREQMLMDQYGEYMADDYDDPYGSQYINAPHTRSQLWNRYTPSWQTGAGWGGGGWGSGYGFSPYSASAYNSPFGFGSPYGFGSQYDFGFGSSGYSPFNQPYGTTTYGWGNQAFMNGYDAWGNPVGWGNPFNNSFAGNGWGYDPWGGGYWGTPGYGYWYNGYHPYYGNLGSFGGCCGTYASGEGDSTPLISPRPRPSFGQFNGYAGSGSGGASGGNDGAGNAGNGVDAAPKPDANRGKVGTRNTSRSRGVTTLPANNTREPDYGRQSPDRSGEPNAQPNRNRSNRSSGRSNGNFNSTPRDTYSPPAPRGGGGSTRPSAPRPTPPRPTPNRSSSRGGRGG